MINAGRSTPFEDSTMDLAPPPAVMKSAAVRMDYAAATHVGKVRPNNEDQYLVARLSKALQVLATSLPDQKMLRRSDDEAYLLLVADGMGGAAAGERASALVVEGLETYVLDALKWFFHAGERADGERNREIRKALNWLDRLVITEAQADRRQAGMGTTLTSAFSLGAELTVVHVGDSRAYLYHDGELEQVTRDHTLTQLMVEAGEMRPEEARRDKRRNIVTNVLGGPAPGVSGEVHRLHLADGDRLLLCTDGLTDPLTDDRIAEILRQHADSHDACRALVEAALERGAPDNVTVVVAKYSIEE